MTSDNHVTGPVTEAMIEAGRNAMVSDEWSSMIDLNRLPQAYLAMKSKEQASVHSPDEVELVTDAIVAAIKADCTEPNGNCYAVGNRDAMEVDGEFDPEAIAHAAIVTMKSKWKRGEASAHSPDEVERVAQALCRHDANKGGIWFDDEALNKHIFNNWRKFQPEARAAVAAMNRDGMREALKKIDGLAGEINPSNYGHDDVCYLNAQFIEAITIARTALETPAKEMGE